ncbi:MAG: hypothetical protein J6L69_06565 [Lachnospiraceae bacterium]|nr:hypothetical protein [Lachnospiraceae bacterium]
MTGLEICLVIIGVLVIAISFVFSEHFSKDDTEKELFKDGKFSEVAQEIIRKEVEKELSLIVDEKMDETKKELNKISAEKILAMGEYSEDINLRITKNHEEVMFLYNMLNDKETVVKNTIKDIEALKVSVKKMAIVNDMSSGQLVQDVVEKKEEIIPENETVVQNDLPAQNTENVENTENKEPAEVKKSKINVKTSNNNKKILELYNKGFSNIEIAKKLGLGVGEVRLVIDLFNSKK